MTINHKVELAESVLRRVRAALGRGGKATRAEVRIWLNRTIAEGIQALPEPKVRRKVEPQAVTRARQRVIDRRKAAEAAPDGAICRHCRKPKADHGRLGYACPAPWRGTTFEVASEPVEPRCRYCGGPRPENYGVTCEDPECLAAWKRDRDALRVLPEVQV